MSHIFYERIPIGWLRLYLVCIRNVPRTMLVSSLLFVSRSLWLMFSLTVPFNRIVIIMALSSSPGQLLLVTQYDLAQVYHL